jgi:hypothetical protein
MTSLNLGFGKAAFDTPGSEASSLKEGDCMRTASIWVCLIAMVPVNSLACLGQDSTVVYPAGTKIMVRINDPLNSATAVLGQEWDGTLVNAVPIGNKVVAPSGSAADGIVSAIKRPGKLKGSGSISLILLHANGVAVTSDVVTRDGEGHWTSNATQIGGLAAVGAGVGSLAAGGTGALVGAAAGATVGTVDAAATNQHKDELSAEAVVTFTSQ